MHTLPMLAAAGPDVLSSMTTYFQSHAIAALGVLIGVAIVWMKVAGRGRQSMSLLAVCLLAMVLIGDPKMVQDLIIGAVKLATGHA